jgi:hypothetical protein
MTNEEHAYAKRKLIENLMLVAIISTLWMAIVTPWYSYFAMGGLVAAVLVFKRKVSQYEPYELAAVIAFDIVLWPAMIWINITQQEQHDST